MQNKPDKLPREDIHRPRGGPVRHSRRALWRAVSLIAVHVAMAVHIAHWKITGSTVTPIEPSEAVEAIELGYVNAGLIAFMIMILSTLVLGRFFCGWACHVVAYQDFCAWLLSKLRIRPKPVRSRLLMLVPVYALVDMFLWPLARKLLEGHRWPRGLALRVTTSDFWGAFPTPAVALLTFFVCGALLVYWLGAKGFCTYGCPYGAVFGLVDRFAAGKIRVTDACEVCGHCTATCTSNVRVHEEVNRYGMVVDPGCMKCMDCISVCPKQALYYGFGKPSVAAKKRPKRKYDFLWREELVMAAVFALSMLALRGLYSRVPFLLAIGLSVLASFAVVVVWRSARGRLLGIQHLTMRANGRVSVAGTVVMSLASLYLLFVAHSGFVRYHQFQGRALTAEAGQLKGNERAERVARSLEHLLAAERWGLLDDGAVQHGIGELLRDQRKFAEAESRLHRAIELLPRLSYARLALADLILLRGQLVEAERMLETILEYDPGFPPAVRRLRALHGR